MQQNKPQTNGHDSDQNIKQIRDELGLQEEILSASQSNPLLNETNLGLGKYDDDYKWQQVRSYRKGLYAWIAFGRVLEQRQLYETKLKLGRDGYNPVYDESDGTVRTWAPLGESDYDGATQSSWSAALERGREIWQRLGSPDEVITAEQVAAVAAKTSITEDWKPLFWELVAGRHEVSRSEDAELLRDALTGIKELRNTEESEESLLS
jgi:hypothetical protein